MASGTPPYGLWPSPLKPVDLANDKRLRDVAWDSDGRTLVWLEGRGATGVLVCQRDGEAPRDLNTGLSVRARVGYGGGDFAVARGQAYFVESSGRIYAQSLSSGLPRALTPAFGLAASPTPSPDGACLVYVHSLEGIDRLATVSSQKGAWPQILIEGADFYMQPAWHPTGRRLAWIEWDQPQMPWDGTRLHLATLRRPQDGPPQVTENRLLAGDESTAIFQPSFSPNGRYLAYISDQRGWHNLWLYDLVEDTHRCLTPDAYDIARPAWIQGLRVYSFSADSTRIYFTRCEEGRLPLYSLDLADGNIAPLAPLSNYTCIEQPLAAPRGKALACIASGSGSPPRIIATRERTRVCARSSDEALQADDFSTPQHLSWRAGNGTTVYGLYYPPTGQTASSEERPPLVVMIHGGPTSQSTAGYEARNQFFATRGWAVLDLNYRGSTGYGRRYMEALRGNWGVLDVEDAVTGGQFLADAGLADPGRLVIMGGSAGGYTVLRALGEHPGFFRAGVCLYGVSDLFSLADDTHKFEASYLDSLVGPLPQAAARYRERSPVFHPDAIIDPLAVFQGSDDEVVPPSQAEAIVDSLRRRHVPHVYHLYQGEGHGWRRPDTIEHFYGAVGTFLKQYVLFS
jgi:dipeptidyl aminopeptidase/acylaminoacyl peptidase